ncbi:MAG: type II CRISPR RNA-guided endonuclease Cas9, partial [Acidobacteriaceae bacterium]|nr:type II CRISPR RNA-guided endonuclease Cas9 [Acidobacteriaceae bacterium]
ARIRNRWTARRMFEDEFAQIWAAQQPHHAATMTPELREQVAHLLFFQRPIAQQKHLIGRCELEPGKRRAPWASMAAQRFRMLQKINDLKYENIQTGESVLLSPEQRQRLYEHLDREGSLKFTALRKFLDLKGTVFNLERGGDKEMPGNRTRKSMLKVFGEHWNTLLPGKQNHIIDQWRNSEADELLQQEAQQHFGLDAEAAAMLAKEKPAADYCSLSLTAIAKLMPYMLDGKSYKAAEKLAYPEFSRLSGMKALDRVPPVREALPALRNPAVERALTEVRKVVNAIVRSHAKPYAIRIELARELKKSRDKRQRAVNNTRRREAERKAAIERILKEIGDPSPRRDLIEKALLFEECGGICPYTGKSMSFTSLVNDGIVQVEHIIPITRFPDNSFQNKTLCDGSFNRMKGNRTPYEVFEGSPEEYEEMLNRVRAWPIKNFSKLNRFRVGEPGIREDNTLEGFSARQLNDTCYTSRSAKKLLATLYGGEVVTAEDGCPQQVVYATSGTVTAVLRRSWGLEAILRELVPPQPGEQRGKPRIDHRHHAIDAITIGATKQRMIQAMARDSARNIDPRTRPDIPAPWKDFVDSIRPHIEQMLVSHRPEHKLSGEFHDETNYGKPYKEGAKTIVHIRKKVTSLTAKDIESIVDAEVRKAVEAKADALDGGLAACEIKNDWPALQARDGRLIPIRKVRMKKVLEVTRIGRGDDTFANTQRYVAESSNHHVAVFARLDVHGKEMRWEGMVVSLLEAYQKASAIRRSEAYRKHHRATSIVQKSIPGEPNQAFKFSLMGGDTIETFSDYAERGKSYKAGIYRVRTIAANGQISLVRISDARMKKDIKAAKEWWSPTVDGLRKLGCSKVVIDLQGNKRYAND